MKRSAAVYTLLNAVSLDAICGALFSSVEHVPLGLSLYWSLTTATTVGYGDVTPHTTAGHILAVIVMLTVVPLFAATFSLLTTALTTERVHSESGRLHAKLDHVIRHHPDIPRYEEHKEEIR